MHKNTYVIPYSDLEKELDGSTCYFEFQKGEFHKKIGWLRRAKMEFKKEDSLFIIDEDVMVIFSFFLPGWELTDIGYFVRGSHRETLMNQLRKFASLLKDGNSTLDSLEKMGVHKKDGHWSFEEKTEDLDVKKIQNTANELANWLEDAFKTHDTISVLGI